MTIIGSGTSFEIKLSRRDCRFFSGIAKLDVFHQVAMAYVLSDDNTIDFELFQAIVAELFTIFVVEDTAVIDSFTLEL